MMKRIVLSFVVALGLGAVTASAQCSKSQGGCALAAEKAKAAEAVKTEAKAEAKTEEKVVEAAVKCADDCKGTDCAAKCAKKGACAKSVEDCAARKAEGKACCKAEGKACCKAVAPKVEEPKAAEGK